MTDTKPLFHELDVPAFRAANKGMTWGDVMQQFRQPDWCGYPEALGGESGCWSLTDGRVTGEEFCLNCDAYDCRPRPPATVSQTETTDAG